MPQRLTVAGLATARSETSKMRFMAADIWMISPAAGNCSHNDSYTVCVSVAHSQPLANSTLGVADMPHAPLLRQSFLLSSRTVFMFSIHTASTGPSNSSHCRSGRVSCAASLKALASTPSFHSWLQVQKWDDTVTTAFSLTATVMHDCGCAMQPHMIECMYRTSTCMCKTCVAPSVSISQSSAACMISLPDRVKLPIQLPQGDRLQNTWNKAHNKFSCAILGSHR